MATIKPIEGRSIHHIQSGQVIVDLCSVAKELIENSLDAGATTIDVRFKNNGLESIEVQDNGAGLSPEDYYTLALKHHTSKLSSYDDLTTLQSYGFRGEALSSLCALSKFHVITARQDEAPRGKRLDFEVSGELKGATVAPCQRGTTVAVEDLFYNLPVRRRELEKNIKREYNKVLGVLHAYACISTGVKLTVSNQMPKGKKVVSFSTKSNLSTKDNIANVFGAKTLHALITLNLDLQLKPSTSQVMSDLQIQDNAASRGVKIVGHISRPVFGEGRQTPDRQMFFVNSRSCGLPQVAKAFNEVYRSYNATQSPFVFANFVLDTNAYDVNVSPDKRTIMLHDQTALLESLKETLVKLFESQEQTVPHNRLSTKKLPASHPLTVTRDALIESKGGEILRRETNQQSPNRLQSDLLKAQSVESSSEVSSLGRSQDGSPPDILGRFVARNVQNRKTPRIASGKGKTAIEAPQHVGDNKKLASLDETQGPMVPELTENGTDLSSDDDARSFESVSTMPPKAAQDFNARIASQQAKVMQKKQEEHGSALALATPEEDDIPATTPLPRKSAPGVVQSAFDRMRPRRASPDIATIIIGSKIDTQVIRVETPLPKKRKLNIPRTNSIPGPIRRSSQFLRAFSAPGTQTSGSDEGVSADEGEPGGESDGGEGNARNEIDARTESEADTSEQANIRSGEKHDRDLHLEAEQDAETPLEALGSGDSDGEYIDETELKRQEEKRVGEMVQQAEAAAVQPTQANQKRAARLLQSRMHKESTLNLVRFLGTSVASIEKQVSQLTSELQNHNQKRSNSHFIPDGLSKESLAEEKLSLTISKSDFAEMRIAGQFNLGFILAIRSTKVGESLSNDLFIIDQHASDEIHNFSRLSQSTVLTPQRLVRPHPLELTAIEEETILTHTDTLIKNGFTISVDTSGDSPVGQRCQLLTLPTSKETVFNPRDLEELIALLGEVTPAAGEVVRPSKVRRMLAMRACRSSIMVGKTLTKKQMEVVVRHMGEIDRPWNCPHGRPTMRHLAELDDWIEWKEGKGLIDDEGVGGGGTDWMGFVKSLTSVKERRKEEKMME